MAALRFLAILFLGLVPFLVPAVTQAPAVAQAPALTQLQTAPAAQTLYWPVSTGRADWNAISAAPDCLRLRCFEAPRPVSQLDNPRRHHAGVDLFANAGDDVIAIEDGEIIGFYPFLRARTGEMSYALLIAHNGYVANYGEVRGNSLTRRGLAIGSRVRAGQVIAEVSDTAQLHFETYASGTTRNYSWGYGAQRPAAVVDPTPRLQELARHATRVTAASP